MTALLLLALHGAAVAADLTTARVVSSTGGAQSNVPVTFGQTLRVGDVPGAATVGGTNGGASEDATRRGALGYGCCHCAVAKGMKRFATTARGAAVTTDNARTRARNAPVQLRAPIPALRPP